MRAQVALSSLVGILDNGPEVLSRVNGSVIDGRSCKLVAGRHSVCFFPCMRYNYCHADQSCCTDPRRLPVSLTTLDELMGARVKVRVHAQLLRVTPFALTDAWSLVSNCPAHPPLQRL